MDCRIFKVHMWSFCMHIHMEDFSLKSHLKDVCKISTECDWGELLGWVQSPAHNSDLSVWWPQSCLSWLSRVNALTLCYHLSHVRGYLPPVESNSIYTHGANGWLMYTHWANGWVIYTHGANVWVIYTHGANGWLIYTHGANGWLIYTHWANGWLIYTHCGDGWTDEVRLTIKSLQQVDPIALFLNSQPPTPSPPPPIMFVCKAWCREGHVPVTIVKWSQCISLSVWIVPHGYSWRRALCGLRQKPKQEMVLLQWQQLQGNLCVYVCACVRACMCVHMCVCVCVCACVCV